jgi:hypothetical protein
MIQPPNPTLLSYLASYDTHVSRLALAVREMVLEEAPEAIESISKGYAVAIGFSFTGKPLKDGFCHIAIYSSYVNLGFNRGALLCGPKKTTGRHRQIESPHYDPQRERPQPSAGPAVSSSGYRTGKPTLARRPRPDVQGRARSKALQAMLIPTLTSTQLH